MELFIVVFFWLSLLQIVLRSCRGEHPFMSITKRTQQRIKRFKKMQQDFKKLSRSQTITATVLVFPIIYGTFIWSCYLMWCIYF